MATATLQPIQERMEVVCSQGEKLGVVDHIVGDKIKLTKNDSSDHRHHFIPTSLVESVDEKVHLSMAGDDIKRIWGSE